MTDNCAVSFLIVSWNGRKLLEKCLDSIYKQTYDRFEVVVVDNGSTDGTVEFVSRYFPKVKLVKLTQNEGFAGGNNRGLPYCSGKYLALVNNDVVLKENWLEEIVRPMEANSCVGLCSSRIYVAGTPYLDSIGDRFTTAFTGTKQGEGRLGSEYGGEFQVHGVCAAAALYRQKMIKEIGFFDEDLFLNYEDTDLNLRAWLQGWSCYYASDAIAYHAVNTTIGTMSPTSVYYFSRNSLLVLFKNFPCRLIIRRIPQRIYYEFLAFVYYAILNRRFLSYLKGKLNAIFMLSHTLRKREKLIKKIKLSDSEILQNTYPIFRISLDRFLKSGG